MGFLDFYTLDLTHILIILFTSGIFYLLLNKLDKEENYKKIVIVGSGAFGIIISVLFSYYTIEPDNPLTENFFA
jgi:hypothetical protein